MKKIPVLINNRDLLDSVRRLVRYFQKVPNVEILLADNASTYPPLLEYYAHECPVTVYHLGKNEGPRGSQVLLNGHDFDFYFMCEPDLCLDGVATDFLQHLSKGLDTHPEVEGAGLSLRLGDLPDTAIARHAWRTERGYWLQDLGDGFFNAGCDTAGVLHRHNWNGDYTGIRSKLHVARHLPWYHTDENRPDDFRWYLKHAVPAGTVYTAFALDERYEK